MSDIVERLRDWTVDWNGDWMKDGEPPRDGLHCDILREAASEIERLRWRLEPASPSRPLKHKYVPNPKYPWFCKHCGYPEHEDLKHVPRSPAAAFDRGDG